MTDRRSWSINLRTAAEATVSEQANGAQQAQGQRRGLGNRSELDRDLLVIVRNREGRLEQDLVRSAAQNQAEIFVTILTAVGSAEDLNAIQRMRPIQGDRQRFTGEFKIIVK